MRGASGPDPSQNPRGPGRRCPGVSPVPPMPDYARPEMLVPTDWVAAHLDDPSVRLVESNEDLLLYHTGHVPGAVKVDWTTDLQDAVVRDYVGAEAFAALCGRLGISNDTTVVFYGDKHNWWATYALWVFRLFGHDEAKLKVMDGGRKKWADEGRPLTRDVPAYPATAYTAAAPDPSVRAFRDEVLAHAKAGGALVDVRSPGEYSGEMTHMPDYPQEGALRGGHIPGAQNVPWAQAVAEDGTFKPRAALAALYQDAKGLRPGEPTIAYCRIGERSSHTWFVLRYLLGFPDVKNYDGSWTEWGNLVGAPIARGPEPGQMNR